MNIIQQLDHPDQIGVSEYRAIYEVLESVELSGDVLDLEMAYGICDEFIQWAQETRRVLTIADRNARRASAYQEGDLVYPIDHDGDESKIGRVVDANPGLARHVEVIWPHTSPALCLELIDDVLPVSGYAERHRGFGSNVKPVRQP